MVELLTGNAVFHWIATWSNPFWDGFFRVMTDHGQTVLYFLLIAPLCWVGDRRRALVLFALLVISSYVNTYAKIFVDTPRPDPQLVRVLDLRVYQDGSRSFPSGHAQNAVVFYGYLAWWIGRSWSRALAAFYIAMISFSRLYLGVHFPIDILGGLTLGALCLAAVPRLERWAAADFEAPLFLRVALVVVPLFELATTSDRAIGSLAGTVSGAALAVLWLPQTEMLLVDWRERSGVVALGLLVELMLLGAMGWATPMGQSPAFLGLSTALIWVTSLWAYPQVVEVILARRVALERADD